jgi:PAS domain S-box-containing protein
VTDPERLPLSGDELFHALVETTDALTYVFDLSRPHGPPVYLSPQVDAVLGRSAEEIDSWPSRLLELVHPDDRDRLLEAGRRTVAEGGVFDEEFRIVLPDGSSRWLRDRAHVVPEREGRPAIWVGFAIDVTARRERQERARLDAAHHRQLVEVLPGIVFRLANEPPYERVTYLSPQIQDVFGYPVDRWIDDPALWTEAIHPDDRDQVSVGWRAAVATETPFAAEYRVIRADGRLVWIRESTIPVRLPNGRVEEWQGLMLDVTDARQAEDERARAEQRWRTLVENAPAIVYTITNEEDGELLYVSPQLRTMLGYDGEPWRSDPKWWAVFVHPDDRDRVEAEWIRCVREGNPFAMEYRVRRADGRTVWIRDHTHPAPDPDGNVSYWVGIALDVTATREAEAALGTTAARYQALVEQLPAVVYVDSDDAHPRSIFVSSASSEILGYPPEAYVHDDGIWPRTIHPDDRQRVLDGWAEATRTGEPFEMEYRFLRPDGSVVWVRDTSIRIEGDGGERMWQGVILDVSRRVLAEQEAGAAAARYQALIEGIPAAVYQMGPDDERRTLYVGPQIEELLGYTRAEWLDQPDMWIELLHPDDREEVLASYDHHNETGAPWRSEYRLIASDGAVVWVRDQAVLVRGPDGNALTWQGVMFDVTEKKAAEEQLRRANDELEFRVMARTSQLAEANELMSLEIGERRRMELEVREAEERYRRLVEDLPAVIYIWHTRQVDGRDPSYISPRIEQMLGFSPAEWHSDWQFWSSRLHPHDRDAVVAATERASRTGEPFYMEYRYLAKDGRVVWVLDQATLLSRDEAGRPAIFQGVWLDITARKLAEAKAAAAEERFREVAESAPAITYVLELDPDDVRNVRIDHVSPEIVDVLGYPMSRWMDDPTAWLQAIHPDDRQTVIGASRPAFASGAPWAIDHRVLAADGRVVWMHNRGRCASRDGSGRPSRFVGVLIDVTESQDAARRARDDLSAATALLEGMPAVPWTEVVDPDTGWRRFAYIGTQAQELFGYSADELIAEPGHFDRMVHPEDRDRVLAKSRRSDRSGEPWVDEYRVVTRDGSVRWFHAGARRVSPDGVSPAIWQGVSVDITETRAADGRGRRSFGTSRAERRRR